MALIREQVPATTTAVPMLSGSGSVNSIHGMAGNEDAVSSRSSFFGVATCFPQSGIYFFFFGYISLFK